jgi:cell division protein FtsI/penicillin-binding protein 2
MDQLHTAMVDAVNEPAGTAHQASLDKVSVAGKTGTAQWGTKEKERTAAWFAGFVPAEKPQYAFAALYEGDVGSKVHGGSAAAPMIADIFTKIYPSQQTTNGRHKREPSSEQKVPRAERVEEDESD